MAGKNKRKWGVLFSGENLTMDEIIQYSKLAAQAGAESLWSTELWRDGIVMLVAMANAAPNVRVGTGVIHFARPPLSTELTAMAMAEVTHGKFVLGLGTAPRFVNEDWYGLSYDKPVSRMRDYVECVRTLWTSTPTKAVSYRGEFYTVKDYRRFIPAPYESIPIYLAAVMPPMLRLAGSHGDGVILNTLNTPKYLTEVAHPMLKKGMAASGRNPKHYEIAAIKPCSVNKDRKQARRFGRHLIAFYSTLPYFDVVLDPMGFTEPKMKIRAAMQRHDIPAMIDNVTEEMVDTLILAGTPDDVRQQMKAFDGLFETPLLFCPFFFTDREETKANHQAMIEAFAE